MRDERESAAAAGPVELHAREIEPRGPRELVRRSQQKIRLHAQPDFVE